MHVLYYPTSLLILTLFHFGIAAPTTRPYPLTISLDPNSNSIYLDSLTQWAKYEIVVRLTVAANALSLANPWAQTLTILGTPQFLTPI